MVELDSIKELIALLDETDGISELSIQGEGGAQIVLKRSVSHRAISDSNSNALVPTASTGLAVADSDEYEPIEDASPNAAQISAIKANRVGLFHHAKPPVGEGELVAVGQIVGYIESIRLMNEVRSDIAGEVVDLMVDEGTPVEYGQSLFRISVQDA